MDPPKGFRAYPLEDNEICRKLCKLPDAEADPPVPDGALTLRLNPFSKDKDTNEPVSWK